MLSVKVCVGGLGIWLWGPQHPAVPASSMWQNVRGGSPHHLSPSVSFTSKGFMLLEGTV